MTSKEALKTLKGYLGIDAKIIELLIPIAKDLDKLDTVWNKAEELLQDELSRYLSEIPYDISNLIKVNVLSKLRSWLEDE